MIRPRLSVAIAEPGGLRFGKFGDNVGRIDASAKNLWVIFLPNIGQDSSTAVTTSREGFPLGLDGRIGQLLPR